MSTVFLAQHFPEDQANYNVELVKLVSELIESHGFNVVDGRDLGGGSIREEVFDRIESADYLVALCTQFKMLRSESENNDQHEWITHEWVTKEFGHAKAKEIRTLALIEDGVFLGGPDSQDYQLKFNRDNKSQLVVDLSKSVGIWRAEEDNYRRRKLIFGFLALLTLFIAALIVLAYSRISIAFDLQKKITQLRERLGQSVAYEKLEDSDLPDLEKPEKTTHRLLDKPFGKYSNSSDEWVHGVWEEFKDKPLVQGAEYYFTKSKTKFQKNSQTRKFFFSIDTTYQEYEIKELLIFFVVVAKNNTRSVRNVKATPKPKSKNRIWTFDTDVFGKEELWVFASVTEGDYTKSFKIELGDAS